MTNIVENMVRQMYKDEATIVEQKAEIEQLREALQHLLDVQNGPPLAGRYAEEWQAAVDKARAALGEEK